MPNGAKPSQIWNTAAAKHKPKLSDNVQGSTDVPSGATGGRFI